MSEIIINTVEDNKDKQRTYAKMMGRYNRALRYEFYLEALLIDYAMLEDRLASMLYHMGIIADTTKLVVDNRVPKEQIKQLLEFNLNKGYISSVPKRINLKNISAKSMMVKAICVWVSECEYDGSDEYLVALKRQCESADIAGILELLDEISDWCKYRNEVIHSALNKNLDALNQELGERVIKGMECARGLDKQVRIISKRGTIRKAAKL